MGQGRRHARHAGDRCGCGKKLGGHGGAEAHAERKTQELKGITLAACGRAKECSERAWKYKRKTKGHREGGQESQT